MRFWDSSAIVPLLVAERRSVPLQKLFQADTTMLVWWASEIECVSAIARLERERAIGLAATKEALERLDAIKGSWHEVQPLETVRRTARRLLLVHALRAADALQLAAAIAASEGQPESLEFVSLDGDLSEAARREGFSPVREE